MRGINMILLDSPNYKDTLSYPVMLRSKHDRGLVVLFFNSAQGTIIECKSDPKQVGDLCSYSTTLLATEESAWERLPSGSTITFTQE